MLNLILWTTYSSLRSRQSLVLENIALRHQLEVLRRNNKTPHLKSRDRLLWVILSQIHTRWRSNLVIVQPKTVVRWHRKGWRLYWKWKSRANRQGRPLISAETRKLIRRMSREVWYSYNGSTNLTNPT